MKYLGFAIMMCLAFTIGLRLGHHPIRINCGHPIDAVVEGGKNVSDGFHHWMDHKVDGWTKGKTR